MSILQSLSTDLPILTPSCALVFHTRGRDALELVTLHAIRSQRGKPALSEGRPLSPNEEQEILALLTASDTAVPSVELNPANLLYSDRHQICWFVPGTRRPMHFNESGQRSQREVMWPNLIFRVVEHTLYLAATASAERPTIDTPLFKAPLANVWANAEVCVGNAILPDASRIAEMPGWESVIFDTAFSHANDRQVIRSARDYADPMDFWKKNGAITAKKLVPMNATLGQWLAAPSRSRRV